MAYIFDGINDRISFADNSAWKVGAGSFTVCLWHKSSTTPANDDRMFGGGQNKRYEAYYNTTGAEIVFSLDDNSTKRDLDLAAPAALTDGVWHPWFFRFESTDEGLAILYGDGGTLTELGSSGYTDTGDIDADAGEVFCIGDGYDAVGWYWPGEICEFALFKRALSTPEMQQIVNGFSPSFLNPDFHVPLIRNANDVRTGLTGTIVGAVASGHAPVIQRTSVLYPFPAAAAGPYTETKDGSLTSSGAFSRHFAGNRTLSGEL